MSTNEIITSINGGEDFEEYSSAQLVSILKLADDAYENGDDPLFEDSTYDQIRKYVTSIDPDNDYLHSIGSDVRGGKVTLPMPMGSLTQVYNQDDISSWMTKHSLPRTVTFVASEKLDGMSGSAYYNNNGMLRIGYSRGNGFEGADITRHLRRIGGIPKVATPNAKIRFEIIISKANFDIVKTLVFRKDGSIYKNPRNMISGLMNSSEIPEVALQYIDCLVYHDWELSDDVSISKQQQLKQLKQKGFNIPFYTVLDVDSMTEDLLSDLIASMKARSPYELDGIVVEVNDAEYRVKMNPSKATLNPEYARKFKVSDGSNRAKAVVSHVELRVSKRGYIKPRVHFHPFSLPGITVTHATGYNMFYIVSNGISPGAEVYVERRGDVVPNIVGFIKPGIYTPEEYVDDLNEIGEWHWSENDKGERVDAILDGDHADIGLKLTDAFFTAIGVDGLKLGNLRKLFDVDINTSEKIIKATPEQLGWALASQTTADKIYASLHKCLKSVTLPQFMGASGLFGRGVGQRKIQKLYDVLGDDILNVSDAKQIVTIESFDQKTAVKFITGLPTYLEFYNSVKEYVQFVTPKVVEGGKLNGQAFVFTGFRNKQLKARIEDEGGEVLDSLTSKVTTVIAADPDERSGKIDKARKMKIRIIGLSDVDHLLFDK